MFLKPIRSPERLCQHILPVKLPTIKQAFCYKLCDRLSRESTVREKQNRDFSLTILVNEKGSI